MPFQERIHSGAAGTAADASQEAAMDTGIAKGIDHRLAAIPDDTGGHSTGAKGEGRSATEFFRGERSRTYRQGFAVSGVQGRRLDC